MKNENYLLQYSEVKNYSLGNFKEEIENLEGINISDLKISNLNYHNGVNIYPGMGVYVFRENKKYKYVGKVSSMSFTERIPKHFDTRPYAWFNSLIETVLKNEKNSNCMSFEVSEYQKVAKHIYDNYNLVLINFEEEKDFGHINKIETLLRASASPLNKFKTKRINDDSLIISKF